MRLIEIFESMLKYFQKTLNIFHHKETFMDFNLNSLRAILSTSENLN